LSTSNKDYDDDDDDIANNALLFYFTLQLTHQTDAASNHSHSALFVVDSLPQIL